MSDESGPGARMRLDVAGDCIEAAWFGPAAGRASAIVMLHEGLGSVAMWKDFPGRLATATGRPVLAWSRAGYGESSPARLPRAPDFMHREALAVLPALRQRLGLERPVLFGHSDGGSIALIHAAGAAQPVEALVVLAPHLFVEAFSLEAIARAREAFETTDLAARLGRYHRDPAAVFRGWNDIWLDPRFASWCIDEEVARIGAPILAVQGEQDEYGTMEQIRRIARLRPGTRLLELPACGHSPHRDQPEAVLAATREFLARA